MTTSLTLYTVELVVRPASQNSVDVSGALLSKPVGGIEGLAILEHVMLGFRINQPTV